MEYNTRMDRQTCHCAASVQHVYPGLIDYMLIPSHTHVTGTPCTICHNCGQRSFSSIFKDIRRALPDYLLSKDLEYIAFTQLIEEVPTR